MAGIHSSVSYSGAAAREVADNSRRRNVGSANGHNDPIRLEAAMLRRSPLQLALVVFVGCSPGGDGQVVDSADVESALFAIHDSMVAGMIAGTSNTAFMTSNWQGVNLNGTPMSAEGFEGEDRVMIYDSIQIIDRNVRLYDGSAALRWHANFFVRVNGQPSFAEMRILDVYVLESGKWLNDLTQVTPIFGTVGNPPGQGGSTGESGNQ